jgi:hypothetical protein
MGYFSNGTEGLEYQDKYCNQCVHDLNHDCPVWLLHLVNNYTADKNIREMLDSLIPRDEKGWNQTCALFWPTRESQRDTVDMSEVEKLKAWNAGKPIKVTP